MRRKYHSSKSWEEKEKKEIERSEFSRNFEYDSFEEILMKLGLRGINSFFDIEITGDPSVKYDLRFFSEDINAMGKFFQQEQFNLSTFEGFFECVIKGKYYSKIEQVSDNTFGQIDYYYTVPEGEGDKIIERTNTIDFYET